MSSSRILVVDDEPDIRDLIGEILRDEGHETETAGNAAEARERVRNSAPDLVLLDIWMPDTDGISLLREWRYSDAVRCRVVVMSGVGAGEAAVEAPRLGAWDFTEKPVSVARIPATINDGLVAGRLGRETAGLRRSQPVVFEPLCRAAAVQQLSQRV